LLEGLKSGRNILQVGGPGLTRQSMDLIDHPLSGPIFSGPHQQPFACQTSENGLGPPLDANCSTVTSIQYYYRTSGYFESPSYPFRIRGAGKLASGVKPYDPAQPPPIDVSQLSVNGRRVPYIVRREVGTINRAVYDIQFLHQPGQALPTPWGRQEG